MWSMAMTAQGYGCDNMSYAFVISNLTVSSICSVLNVIAMIKTTYNFTVNLKSSNQTTEAIGKRYVYICIISLVLFLLESISCLICTIIYQICPSERGSSILYSIFTEMFVNCCLMALISICLLFTIRFIGTFADSFIQISTKLRKFLYFLCIAQIILYLSGVVIRILLPSAYAARGTFAALFTITYIASFTYLIYLFTKKLLLFSNIAHSINNGNNNENKIGVYDNNYHIDKCDETKQTEIINIASKIVVCCVLAILSSLLAMIVFNITVVLQDNMYALPLTFTMYNIDTFLNSFFLMLQWPFADSIYVYDKYCTICDRCSKKCCVNSKTKESKDAEHVRVTNVQTNRDHGASIASAVTVSSRSSMDSTESHNIAW